MSYGKPETHGRHRGRWRQWVYGWAAIALLGLALGIWSCTPSEPAASSTAGERMGQTLPITAQVTIADQTIALEVAKTPEQQAIGLMHRPSLPADRGMLFIFQPPRQVGFWMKNVQFDLDMVFLNNGTVVAVAPQVPPCTADPCPVYGPPTPVDQVIELQGGRAAELGIAVGDRLVIEPHTP